LTTKDKTSRSLVYDTVPFAVEYRILRINSYRFNTFAISEGRRIYFRHTSRYRNTCETTAAQKGPFYSPDSHYGCRETIEEPIWDKSAANFCDYFRLKASNGGAGGFGGSADKAAKSREALAKLFDF